MIVPAPVIHRVLDGTATHIRTLARTPRAPWHPGQSVPIRAHHHAPAAGRILIIEARHQLLSDITHQQLRDEGWHGRNPLLRFAHDWIARHDPGYRDALPHATDDEILHRLSTRHGTTDTWRIAVTPDPHAPPRLLAARSEHGYTSSPHLALPDEPEAIDAAAQDAITREARRKEETRMATEAPTRHAAIAADLAEAHRRIAAAREHAKRHAPHLHEPLRRAAENLRRAEREAHRQP